MKFINNQKHPKPLNLTPQNTKKHTSILHFRKFVRIFILLRSRRHCFKFIYGILSFFSVILSFTQSERITRVTSNVYIDCILFTFLLLLILFLLLVYFENHFFGSLHKIIIDTISKIKAVVQVKMSWKDGGAPP